MAPQSLKEYRSDSLNTHEKNPGSSQNVQNKSSVPIFFNCESDWSGLATGVCVNYWNAIFFPKYFHYAPDKNRSSLHVKNLQKVH